MLHDFHRSFICISCFVALFHPGEFKANPISAQANHTAYFYFCTINIYLSFFLAFSIILAISLLLISVTANFVISANYNYALISMIVRIVSIFYAAAVRCYSILTSLCCYC